MIHDLKDMARRMEEVSNARSRAADGVIEEMEFGDFAYAGRTGWETDGPDRLRCSVFLERPIGSEDPSHNMALGIEFETGSADVISIECETPDADPELCFEI